MATDTDGPPGPLSEFGDTRLDHFARKRAERIDAQTSTWRYYASITLALVSAGSVLGVLIALGMLLAVPFFDVPVWVALRNLGINIVVAAVAGHLSNRVSNPESGDLI